MRRTRSVSVRCLVASEVLPGHLERNACAASPVASWTMTPAEAAPPVAPTAPIRARLVRATAAIRPGRGTRLRSLVSPGRAGPPGQRLAVVVGGGHRCLLVMVQGGSLAAGPSRR